MARGHDEFRRISITVKGLTPIDLVDLIGLAATWRVDLDAITLFLADDGAGDGR